MIDEQTEENAALYALDLLEGAELAAFNQRLQAEPTLRELVEDLQSAVSVFAHGASARTPSPQLEDRIRHALLADMRPAVRSHVNWIPWAIAAALMTMCVLLAVDRERFSKRVAKLEHRDLLAQTQIAILSSQLASAPKAQAVVLWDVQKQEGVLKVIGTPVTSKDRDYQLWIVDPRYQQPVDAGVFAVEPDGTTKITFRPKSRVDSVKAFAVTLERKGGVPKAEGPTVLVGK